MAFFSRKGYHAQKQAATTVSAPRANELPSEADYLAWQQKDKADDAVVLFAALQPYVNKALNHLRGYAKDAKWECPVKYADGQEARYRVSASTPNTVTIDVECQWLSRVRLQSSPRRLLYRRRQRRTRSTRQHYRNLSRVDGEAHQCKQHPRMMRPHAASPFHPSSQIRSPGVRQD